MSDELVKNNLEIKESSTSKVSTLLALKNKKLPVIMILIVFLVVLGTISAVVLWVDNNSEDPSGSEGESSSEEETLCGGGSDMRLDMMNSDSRVGEPLVVSLVVDTHDCEIDAIDIVVLFDPDLVEIKDIEESENFTMYPLKEIGDGKMRISALAEIGEPVRGSLEVSQFTVVPLKSGNIELTCDFTKGSTVDSNVAEHKTGIDLLVNVNTLILNVD